MKVDRDAFNRAMERMGWKHQYDLAREVGMTPSQLSNVLHDKRDLTFAEAVLLAQALSMTMPDLAIIMGCAR